MNNNRKAYFLKDLNLQEEILSAWILINAQLKESRLTNNLTYNEAIVMKNIYDNYVLDGIGKTSVQSLIKNTNILKSLMNRIINSLVKKKLLRKEREGRNVFVYPIKERIEDFLTVHNNSLKIAECVIEGIGEKDAAEFVRIAKKFAAVKFDFNYGGKK